LFTQQRNPGIASLAESICYTIRTAPDTSMSKGKRARPDVGETVDSVIVHDMKNLAFRLSTLLQNMDENYENPLFKKSMTDVLGDTIRKMNAIVKRFKEQQQHVIVKLKLD